MPHRVVAEYVDDLAQLTRVGNDPGVFRVCLFLDLGGTEPVSLADVRDLLVQPGGQVQGFCVRVVLARQLEDALDHLVYPV